MKTCLESEREFYIIKKNNKILGNYIVSHYLLFFLRKDKNFPLPVLYPDLCPTLDLNTLIVLNIMVLT